MTRPHPALLDFAAGRSLPLISDPDRIVASAIDHRVAPLLLAELRRHGRTLHDSADRRLAFEELAQRAYRNEVEAAFTDAVSRLAAIAREVGIAKGLSTASRWWPDPLLRPCNDVDLFLSPTDIDRLDDVCDALEIRTPHPGFPLLLARNGRQQVPQASSGALSIDVHLDIDYNGPRANDRIRTGVLNLLYPNARRLTVREALANNRRRELFLPLAIPVREAALLGRLIRLGVPTRAIVAHKLPNDRGPFLWRAARYRLRQQREPCLDRYEAKMADIA